MKANVTAIQSSRTQSLLSNSLDTFPSHPHLCSISYSYTEQIAVAVSFINLGLRRGEQCLYLAADLDERAVHEAFESVGVDVGEAVSSGALALTVGVQDEHRRQQRDSGSLAGFWEHSTEAALRRWYSGFRAAGATECVAEE